MTCPIRTTALIRVQRIWECNPRRTFRLSRSRWFKTSTVINNKTKSHCAWSQIWLYSSKAYTLASFSAWSSSIKSSLAVHWGWTKAGEKIQCKPLMTTATRLRTRLSRLTLSIYSSRKATLGQSQSLSATIEESVSIVSSSASLFQKVLAFRCKICQLSLVWSAPSTSYMARMKFTGQSTSLTESSVMSDNSRRVMHLKERLGYTKMPCSVSPTHALFS